MAGDYYRLACQQTGIPHRLTLKIATVVLDLINANVPAHQRHYIILDAITHRLQFKEPLRDESRRRKFHVY